MNALSKVILVTASFYSFIALSMEQVSATNLEAEHKETLTHLYSLTQHVLSNSNLLGYIHSSFSEKPTHNLLAIITETNDLRKKRITEEHIARLAYTKDPSLFEQNQSFLEKFENFVSHNSKASNYHIAIFFKQLEIFNNHLAKNNFLTPTFEQYENYLKNKNIELSFKKAIKNAENFGILLDETMIHTDKKPFTPLHMNIATEELEKLIDNIKTMCDENTVLIKSLADLLYLNNQEATNKK